MSPEEEARRARYLARQAFQRQLDAALTPPSQAPAQAVRDAWEPIELLITEGPDVGEADFPESEAGQRIN